MHYRTINEMYKGELSNLIQRGMISKPRGFATREIIGRKIILTNTHNMYNEFTKGNFQLALNAALITVSKINLENKYLELYKSSSFYSDNYNIFHYSMGKSLQSVIDTLKNDRDSRQAVLNYGEKFCTNLVNFIIRKETLVLSIYSRSVDAYKKLPIDAQYFCILQQIVANELGVKCGPISWNFGSLHFYCHNEVGIANVMKSFSSCTSRNYRTNLKYSQVKQKTIISALGGELFE